MVLPIPPPRAGWLVATFAFSLLLAGCESAPTEPVISLDDQPALSYSPAETPEVVESSIVVVENGSNRIISFTDTKGNLYRTELDVDALGRLTESRIFLNGSLLGSDVPSWLGMDRTGHRTTTTDGYWATSTANYEPISAGAPRNLCDRDIECVVMMSGPICGREFTEFAGHTAFVIGAIATLSGASFLTGPLAPIAMTGAASTLVGTLTFWGIAIHDLDRCVKERGKTPPIEQT